MMFRILFVFWGLSSICQANLQSEFQSRLESIATNKTTAPEKVQAAIKLIEKKIASKIETSENMQSDIYQVTLDSQKYFTYIDQLIYVKFKNQTICRGQLETFQNRQTYQGLQVICIDEKRKVQTFQETI